MEHLYELWAETASGSAPATASAGSLLNPLLTALKEEAAEVAGPVPAPVHPDDPFFQAAEFSALELTLDWQPKWLPEDEVASKAGDRGLAELALALAQLNPLKNMALRIKPTRVEGARGWGYLAERVGCAWREDLLQHQGPGALLNTYLRGIAPINAVAKGIEAAIGLVAAPVRGYNQAGVEGMYRQTVSAGRDMAAALTEEGASLAKAVADGAQAMLEVAAAGVEEAKKVAAAVGQAVAEEVKKESVGHKKR